jgi:hypothetical protein
MLESEWVNCHPLHNAASTTLRSTDLLRFVRALGYEPIVVRLQEAQNRAASGQAEAGNLMTFAGSWHSKERGRRGGERVVPTALDVDPQPGQRPPVSD